LFAALVQKLLGDLQGGSANPGVGTPAQSILPFASKGAAKSGSVDPAAEKDARPAKSQPKNGQDDSQLVSAVQQPDLMHVLNLVPPPAGAPSTAGSPVELINTDGSAPSEPASTGVENASPVAGVLTGNLPESSGQQVSISQQSVYPDAGTGMLLSFFKNVSTFGTRIPVPPGSPVRNVSPGQGDPAQQDLYPDQGGRAQRVVIPDQTMTPELAVQPDKTIISGLTFQTDQSASTPLKTGVPNPFVPRSTAPGAPTPPAANPAAIIGSELKSGPADMAQDLGQGMSPAASQPPQVQSPAPTVPVTPALQVVSPEVIDPSVLPRVAVAQPRNAVDSAPRISVNTRDDESTSRGEDTLPARAGFFTSVVSDVLDMIAKGNAESLSSDTQEEAPASAPLGKNGSPPVNSVPAFADGLTQPVKKAADIPVQESGTVSTEDVMRPAREQVDLTAMRSSQAAQATQALSDKPDSMATAAPLRDLPSPYAPLPAEVSRRIADQVVQNLKLQVDGTASDIRMTLKPPSLGEVQLSVHVEDSRMQAQINVTQQVVKTALEAHMPQLRQALQDHGIEVQRIDVMLPEQSLQHDGTGANGERTGRRGGRRLLPGDDTEAYREAKDMGYNTIELIM